MKDTVSEGMMTIIVIVVVGLLMVLAKEVVWPIISEKVTTGVENIDRP